MRGSVKMIKWKFEKRCEILSSMDSTDRLRARSSSSCLQWHHASVNLLRCFKVCDEGYPGELRSPTGACAPARLDGDADDVAAGAGRDQAEVQHARGRVPARSRGFKSMSRTSGFHFERIGCLPLRSEEPEAFSNTARTPCHTLRNTWILPLAPSKQCPTTPPWKQPQVR